MNDVRLNKWYYDEDQDQRFEVIDLKEDYIVVQGLDGSVSEYSIEEWEEREFVSAQAPESWEMAWEMDGTLADMDERFEAPKRSTRSLNKDDEADELEDFSFSDDLEDSQDFDAH